MRARTPPSTRSAPTSSASAAAATCRSVRLPGSAPTAPSRSRRCWRHSTAGSRYAPAPPVRTPTPSGRRSPPSSSTPTVAASSSTIPFRRRSTRIIRLRRRQNGEGGVDVTVFLVGAGPGDPGLITVRGAELLGRADVVVYDRLVARSLLELAPPTAERISV